MWLASCIKAVRLYPITLRFNSSKDKYNVKETWVYWVFTSNSDSLKFILQKKTKLNAKNKNTWLAINKIGFHQVAD